MGGMFYGCDKGYITPPRIIASACYYGDCELLWFACYNSDYLKLIPMHIVYMYYILFNDLKERLQSSICVLGPPNSKCFMPDSK